VQLKRVLVGNDNEEAKDEPKKKLNGKNNKTSVDDIYDEIKRMQNDADEQSHLSDEMKIGDLDEDSAKVDMPDII